MAKSLPVLSTPTDVATTRSVLGTIADSTTAAMATIARGFMGVAQTIQSVGDKLSLDLEPIGPEGVLTQKLAEFGEGIQKRLDKLIGLQSDTDDSNEQRAKLLEDDKRDAQANEADKDRDETKSILQKLVDRGKENLEDPKAETNSIWSKILMVAVVGVAAVLGTMVGVIEGIIDSMRWVGRKILHVGRKIFKTVFKTVDKMLGGGLSGMFKLVKEDFANTIDRIRDLFKSWRTSLSNTKLGKFFSTLKLTASKWLTDISETFKSLKEKTLKNLTKVKKFVVGFFDGFFKPFKPLESIKLPKLPKIDLLKKMEPIVDFFTKGPLGKAIKVFTKFKQFGKFLGPLGYLVTVVIEAFQSVPKIIESFQKDGFMGGLETVIDEAFRILFGDLGNLLKDVVSWIANKLGFENFSKALDGLDFTKFFDEFTDKIFSGDFFGAFDVVVDEITKFFDTLFGGDDKGDDKGEGIFASMQSKFKSFGDGISNFVTSLLGYFTPVKDYILGFFDSYPALKTVKDTITDVFDKLGDTFGNIIDKLKSVINFFSPTKIKEVVVEKLGPMGLAALKLLGLNLDGENEKEPPERKEQKQAPSVEKPTERKERKRAPSVKKPTPGRANRLRVQSGESIAEFRRSTRKSKMLMFETIEHLAKNGEISEIEYVKFYNDIKGMNQLYTVERVNNDTKVSKESVENFVRAKFGIEKNTRSISDTKVSSKEGKRASSVKKPTPGALLEMRLGKTMKFAWEVSGESIEEFQLSARKSKMLMFETIKHLAKNGESIPRRGFNIEGMNQLYTQYRVNYGKKVSKESVENFVRNMFGIEKNTRSIEKVQSDIKMPDVSTSPLLSTPVEKFTPVQQSRGGDLIENLSNTTSTGGTTIIDNTVVNNTYNTDNSRSSTANVVTNPVDSKLSGGGMDRPL